MFLAKSERDFKEKVAILANRCCKQVDFSQFIFVSTRFLRINKFSQNSSQSNSIRFSESIIFHKIPRNPIQFVFYESISFRKILRNPIQLFFYESISFRKILYDPIQLFFCDSTCFLNQNQHIFYNSSFL